MAAKGIGVIGCGGRIRGVMNHIPGLGKKIKVVAMCDPDKHALKEMNKTYGKDITVYDDYKKLVKDPAVEWVLIGSLNCQHRDHTIAAFNAGKHVFCEKPLATTIPDCVAMKKAWEKSGKMFNIGFTLRYSPHYRKIKKIIDDGLLGDIVSMEFNETLDFNHGGYIAGNWRRFTELAGTHLLEKCSHDVDLVNWMIGSRASRVAGFGGLDFFTPKNKKHQKRIGKGNSKDFWKNNAKPVVAYEEWADRKDVNPFTCKKDILDNQVAIVEYENGVRTTFHTNLNAGIPERRMYILGTEGTLRADVIPGKIEVKRIGFNTKLKDMSTKASGGHGGGDELLGKEIAASILRGTPPSSTLSAGLESAIMCFGIDKATSTGKVVDMKPFWKNAGL